MTTIHRIGVISDTHIPSRATRIPDSVLKHFENVELILHAGDHSTLAAIRQLEAYSPVIAVQGNVEYPEIISAVPVKREIEVGGVAVGLIHILGEKAHYAQTARREFPSARVVVFGHSHIPYLTDEDGLMLLNPGSATDRRFQPACTIALLEIADGAPRARIITLP